MRCAQNILLLFLALSMTFLASFSPVLAQDKKGSEDKRDRRGGREFWSSLSEEQREKLREALREVWTDPGVISAREEVKRASDSYQKAVREAISKTDPDVAKLIIEAGKDRAMTDHHGGPPHYRYSQRRGGDYPMGPPGFLEKLSPEKRERFLEVQKEAEESEKVGKARAALDALRQKDDGLRKQRMRAHINLRRAILESMIEIEPEFEKYRDALKASPGPRPPGAGAEKGKSEPRGG
ncbi:MAG: hypothetical protein CMO55_03175 [Verrucomicrobiales bacterium]|nr:hypothetical protein [Verrucomicrobiales bacterium]